MQRPRVRPVRSRRRAGRWAWHEDRLRAVMPSSLPLLLSVAVTFATLVLGLRAVVARAKAPELAQLPLVVSVALALWLVLTGAIARSGALSVFESLPPRLMMLPMSAIVVMVVVTRGATFRRLLAAMPPAWPVALMSFRVIVELMIWQLYKGGAMPRQMTFEGRNFDVLVGLSAPVIAHGLANGWLGRRAAILWNVAGLALLLNVVVIAVTSVPGPTRLDWGGEPLTIVATTPFVWLPAFLVPVAVFGHVSSLRQLLARRDAMEAATG